MLLQTALGYDMQVLLTVIYGLGAVASIWGAILSPFLFDWLGTNLNKKVEGRNWPKRFLISLILQPVTFTVSAVVLWWYPLIACLPAFHFLLTAICLVIIDFNREDEMWEKGYTRLF